MKTLAEHNKERYNTYVSIQDNMPIENGIRCPNCGEELCDAEPMYTLTTNPPQKRVLCKTCGWTGLRLA